MIVQFSNTKVLHKNISYFILKMHIFLFLPILSNLLWDSLEGLWKGIVILFMDKKCSLDQIGFLKTCQKVVSNIICVRLFPYNIYFMVLLVHALAEELMV